MTHAVVVVHGILRNSKSYFAGMMQAATKNHADADTIVVAPWFQTSQDKPGERGPYWVDQPPRRADAPGWLQGDGAVRPAGLSSFAVVDDLLDDLADPQRFPNLRSITVAGHSAGGQFVQRYAAFGTWPGRPSRVPINYVAANASSYVYFDPTRPVGDGTQFAVPAAAGGCPGYDTYKYGLAGRTGYVGALSPEQALAQYLGRRVTIVNGADDTFDNGDEDTTCAAVAQGQHRAARGANYLTYIQGKHPTAPHDRIVVPDVGHSQSEIFSSPLVAPVLFGR